MKKEQLFLIISMALLAIAMLWPVHFNVVVVKDDITSNRVFAGRINDVFVGTEVCCKYWLEPKEQHAATHWDLLTTPLGWLMGYVEIADEEEVELFPCQCNVIKVNVEAYPNDTINTGRYYTSDSMCTVVEDWAEGWNNRHYEVGDGPIKQVVVRRYCD